MYIFPDVFIENFDENSFEHFSTKSQSCQVAEATSNRLFASRSTQFRTQRVALTNFLQQVYAMSSFSVIQHPNMSHMQENKQCVCAYDGGESEKCSKGATTV